MNYWYVLGIIFILASLPLSYYLGRDVKKHNSQIQHGRLLKLTNASAVASLVCFFIGDFSSKPFHVAEIAIVLPLIFVLIFCFYLGYFGPVIVWKNGRPK